ncbi:DUF3500 domain-containing protein [Tundrisphaera sp. TA3]|uniref:DUF3500 domain-containing protein n=1 Tax=Tundrisphaera sp. TA3 TaxID=3435775 RepID=UPI003EC03E0E
MTRHRTLFAALALLTTTASWAAPAAAHDGPLGHAHESPMARAGREMAEAANNLWASLTPEQQQKVATGFDDPLRHDWHFIPRPRKGLPLKEMSGEQKALATVLLSSGLGQRGFVRAETIISLEKILFDKEQGKGPTRDPELYFFNIFGKPGSADPKQPWGWRVEGHHLALNFTIVGDQGVAGGPTFMGSNPAKVMEGPRQGLRVLGEEEDLARSLVRSLDADRRKKAVILEKAPKDIISMASRKAEPLEPAGILMADLTAEQKETLNALIVLYAERLRPELAADDLAKIMKAGVDKVGFAWAGELEEGKPHYYRVQGPTFLLEYDNTQGNANHVHSVWRDFDGDFGEDLLKAHYESAGAAHGHAK